jgi:hypothetical protein
MILLASGIFLGVLFTLVAEMVVVIYFEDSDRVKRKKQV